jgi:hypothetical protein
MQARGADRQAGIANLPSPFHLLKPSPCAVSSERHHRPGQTRRQATAAAPSRRSRPRCGTARPARSCPRSRPIASSGPRPSYTLPAAAIGSPPHQGSHPATSMYEQHTGRGEVGVRVRVRRSCAEQPTAKDRVVDQSMPNIPSKLQSCGQAR